MTIFRSGLLRGAVGILIPMTVLAGCSLGTQRHATESADPSMPLEPPRAWASRLDTTQTASRPSESWPSESWIAQFGSDDLPGLTEKAAQNSFSLASLQAQLRAAYESVATARALGRPQLGASIGGGAQLTSTPGQNDPSQRQQDWTQLLQYGVTASWEADIWGRISAQTRAAVADVAATEADLAGADLALRASVVSTWINLANAVAQGELAQDQLRVRSRSLELTERRFATGLATALDVRLARSSEATAKAEIADAQRNVADLTGRLQTLLGDYPNGQLDPSYALSSLAALPPMTDIANPASILTARPDILASEARLRAAGLRTIAARAALRPSLSLNASFDARGDDIAKLFDISYITGQILAGLTAPLSSGGRLSAARRSAEALAEAAAASYAQTVLDAWREVENARIAEVYLAEAEDSYQIALGEARAAESLAERQYQNGLISIFNLLDAQTSRIGSERAFNATRAARYLNRVAYHLALGGDGSTTDAAEPPVEDRQS